MPEKNAFSKYDVQLPYNTRLGQSMAEVISKVPEPGSHLAEDVHDGGSLILSTKNSKGLLWLSFDSPGQDVVEEATFDPEGCR